MSSDPATALVVDAANVIGSVPDGWWRDRAGAAARLNARLAAAQLPHTPIVVVYEGAAKRGVPADPDARPVVVHAPGSGDDEIVRQAKRYAVDGPVAVVTADRGLIDRVRAVGADVIGPGWLLDRLPEAPRPE
ncbi:hypothetical protein GGQ54_001361 [Naumannella cuiyingiana]|uniref:NTP pyrophosphohydrolase n=1 Tax=Naumannella cuiyingiana TaxID=1347891 RepID=A0A7Z0D8N4_9ACTN|nr:hypothetical protein [Naumannella cuiyingiana]NYI70801.1 hypothetical protein [Naumannella cuiyingiana]